MKLLKKGFIVQFVGVLTLVFGNFYTAGAAVADVVATDEIATKNAKLIDDKRQLVTNAKVGDKANLAFDTTVGSLSQSGKVAFDYDEDVLKIKKDKYKFKNGSTKVVVDIDGKDSTIEWRNAIDKTDLEVVLPVKFSWPVDRRELTIKVDEKDVKLPTLTVVNPDAKKTKKATAATNEKVDGNLQDDNLVNKVLAEAEKDEAASDQAEAAKQAEETKKAEAKKQAAADKETVKKEADSQDDKSEQQPVSEEPKKETEIDENSSQADVIEEPKQSDSDKAKEFVKEKREADRKAAEEKSQKAVENLKKAAEKDAQAPQDTNQSGSGIQRSSGNNKEIRTQQDSSLAGVDVAKKALAGDDDDANEVSGESLRSTLPVNGVFRSGTGSRDLGELKLVHFFDMIQLTDDKGNKKFINGTLDDNVSIPADFRNSKEITINWTWNTQSINELNNLNPVIQNGDYYTFNIKGFEYAYKDGNSDTQNITDKGQTIGKFTISKTGDDHIQNVRIDFTPGVNTEDDRIEYGASAKTTLSQKEGEISFGEIADEEHKITIQKGKLDLKKIGDYKTDKDEQENKIIDYSKLHWTANFTTDDALEEVTLQDEFGAGYDFQGATYKFTITPDSGKTITVLSSDETKYNSIVGKDSISQRADFKFKAEQLLGSGDKIKAIQVDVIANITDFDKPDEYINQIKVSHWKNGDQSGKSGPWAQAKVGNNRKMLNKKADIVKGGNVKYTVRFTVSDSDAVKDLIMKDELGSKLFMYDKDSFTLTPIEQGKKFADYATTQFNNNEKDDPGAANFSATFNEKIKEGVTESKPITYELSYEITPKDPSKIKDADYKKLTNTVTWKGTSKFESVEDPKFNTKTSSGANWTDFTTDWEFEINKFDRKVGFPIEITEPAQEGTNDYLDFAEFHKIIRETPNNISNYIQIYTNDGTTYQKQEVTLKGVWNGINKGVTYKWNSNNKDAFLIQKMNDSEDFKLTILSSPTGTGETDTHNFKVELKRVPIKKEALAMAKDTVLNIQNCADIEYNEKNGEKDKVCASVALPKLVRENISKVGKLSSDFSDPTSTRKIHWTSSFNFKDYLGIDDSFTITDNFGEGDSVTAYDGDKPTSHPKQLQSISYDGKNPAKDIKVSFGQLNAKGDQVERYDKDTSDFYNLSFIDEPTTKSFKLKIELTVDGKNFIKNNDYNVLILDYSSDVKSLSLEPDKDYEHLKKWLFNNKVEVSTVAGNDLKTSAQTSYTDAGYLLDKSGQRENIYDKGREITAIKWNVLVNGEGKKFTGPIQLVDQITSDNQNHLRAQNSDYHVKIFKAERNQVKDEGNKDNQKVEYTPTGLPISSNNYTLEYSLHLDKMTIQFKEGYELEGPLIVQYYTEIQKTVGANFENKVTLSLGDKKFTQGTVLESGIDAWGSIKHFSVNVIKRDDITGDPLEGVEFKLQKMNKGGQWEDVMTTIDQEGAKPEVYKLRTGANGMATFMDLTSFGKYRIVETEGLSGRFEQYESKLFTMADVDKGKAVYVLEVTNPYDGDLIIKKNVNNNGLETSKDEFNFEVKAVNDVGAVNEDFAGSFEYAVYDKEGKPVMNGDDPIEGTVIFEDGIATGLPAIKDGQQIKISGLPQNQHFKIKELGAEKYDTTHRLTNTSNDLGGSSEGKETDKFKLREGEKTDSTVATFTNSIEPGDFAFSKTIEGPNVANDKDKQFDFYLEAVDKDGNRDKTFSGNIDGWKHSGGSDTKVTFHFVEGKADTVTIGEVANDNKPQAIQLRDGENYHRIQLPKNVQFKVYERQDDTYKYTRYTIDEHNHGEAPSKSDGDGDYHYVGPINTDGKHLKFINEQKENSFEFEKIVSGKESAAEFKFQVKGGNQSTVDAIAGNTYAASLVNARTGIVINDHYKIQFDNKGEATKWYTDKTDPETQTDIALMHEQKVVITGLPIEATQFVVTELVSDRDWNIQHQIDGDVERDGNVATLNLNREDGRNSIMFRNLDPELVSFKIKKTVSGIVPPKENAFQFKLTIKNPNNNWGAERAFRAVKSSDMKEFDLEFTRNLDGTYTASQTLKADESLTIFTLKGLKVYVEEENHQGYDVSYQYGDHKGDSHAYEITTGDGDCGQPCLPPLIFNNHVPGTAVEIEKKLAGKTLVGADHDKKFRFDVQGTDKEGEDLSGDFDIEVTTAADDILKGTVTFKDGKIENVALDDRNSTKKIILKSDEKAKILGLTDGAKVKVIELAGSYEGFDPSYVLNTNSVQPGNDTGAFTTHENKASTVQFINTKLVPKTTNLQVSKDLAGNGIASEDGDKEFKFIITAVDPETELSKQGYDANKLNHDGTTTKLKVKFQLNEGTNKLQYAVTLRDKEKLMIEGLPLDVKFNVEEIEGDDEGFNITHVVNKTQLKDGNKTIDFNLREEDNTVEFINTKQLRGTGALLIQKHLGGSGITEADENRTFDFQLMADIGGKFTATKFKQDGSRDENIGIEFKNGKSTTISLKSDERLIIDGLPLETQFSVTELGANDFKTTWNVNHAKTHDGKITNDFKLVEEDIVPVLFTNTKQAPDTANLKISKTLAGNGLTDADKDRVFNFRIYSGASGTYKAVKAQQNGDTSNTAVKIQNGQSDVITLRADESLNVTGLPIDHTYAVGEQYVGDYAASYKVNGGTVTKGMTTDFFKMVADQNGTVEFTNTKDGDIGMGSFSVNKFVNETGDRTRTFNFSLEVVDGAGNPLDGTFETQTTTNGGTPTRGMITINGGNATFTLTHGQSIKFVLPMGARYEVSEQDYTKDGYVTTVTKRGAAYTGTHVFGTVTSDNDTISYHNDLEEDEAELPLPGDEDTPDSSATLDEPDALPASDGTSGKNGTSGITSPQGLPSAGYTGKQALPQTGEDDGKLFMIIGVIILVMVAVAGTIYYTKRKQVK